MFHAIGYALPEQYYYSFLKETLLKWQTKEYIYIANSNTCITVALLAKRKRKRSDIAL